MTAFDRRPGALLERMGATSGVAWFVLIMVGNTLNTAGTTQALRPTGEEVLADLQRTTATQDVGLVLELLGFAVFAVFLGYLYRTLRRADAGSWLPAAALVGGVTMLAVKLGSAGPMFAAVLRKDEISPELARTLVDINSGAFWISWLPFAVLVGAAGGSLLRSRLVARPIGWIGLVLGVAGIVPGVSLSLAMSDAGAAPFLLSACWLAVVSGVLAVRGVRTATAPDTPVVVRA